MKKLLYILCLAPLCAHAAVDYRLVGKAEDYLNGITGLTGEFSQLSNGKKDGGAFSMLRPGRIRLDYKTRPIQLISNGKSLYFYDRSLDQITTLPLTSTPAGILVRKRIDLANADIEVSETLSTVDGFAVKMHIRNQEGAGNMSIFFSANPVALRSWTVIDATGAKTEVAFKDLRTKTDFSKNYFELQKMKTATNSAEDAYYR